MPNVFEQRTKLTDSQKWDHVLETGIRKTTLGIMAGVGLHMLFFSMFWTRVCAFQGVQGW
eukprot:NODE_3260_length_578_cov_6.807183_g2745_i0.p3 GENE.NODE_3260_length_578_cov_6.807183_g2745_i0~~NODE_3260_length_578_cov_6.807183_g2745_i0.p3  ORF type:complete len:60 (+),score=3.65 NODE_3260_length_578_cov_6.807183_g2745_i0:75-254(+)